MAAIRIRSEFLREWIDGATIQKSGGDCDSEYGTTAETGFAWALYHHALQLFSILVPLSSPKFSKKDGRSLKELSGKLFLWGDSFRDGRLESVLDESDDLKETVVSELTGIGNILISKLVPSCEVLAPPSTRDEIRQLAGELSILLEKAKLVTEGDYDSDATSGQESDAPSRSHESVRAISSLKTTVECLMDLLPSMENALEYMRKPNLDDEATSAIAFQVSGPARTYVLNVYDRFAKADSRLVERLGEANWQRHAALRAALTQENEPIEIPSTATIFGGQELPKSVFKPVSMFHDSGMGTTVAANSSYAVTVASHSSFVSSLADKDSGSLRVPPTPKEVSQGIPFACDICGHILSRIKNRVDWRRHVFADLKPYICTFSGCKDELLTFPTRKLWEDHEFTQHRVDRTWSCSDCPQSLPDPDKWRDHIRDHHGSVFNDSQFDIASKMAEKRKPQSIKSHQCPLCLCFPGKSKRNFATHVGKHMEGIALAALPREATSDSESDDESLADTWPNSTQNNSPEIDVLDNQPSGPSLRLSSLPSTNPYSTYKDSQMLAIGVLREREHCCQYLGAPCKERFPSPEALQLHFDTAHFGFLWISPPQRYVCRHCQSLNSSNTVRCLECGSSASAEVWIYGEFVYGLWQRKESSHENAQTFDSDGLKTTPSSSNSAFKGEKGTSCQRCRKSKKRCDRQRPCRRCTDGGIDADQCITEDESHGRNGRENDVSISLQSPAPPEKLRVDEPYLVLATLEGETHGKVLLVPRTPQSISIERAVGGVPNMQPQSWNGFFDSKFISNKHAEIWADGAGKIWIRDVASTNGTFVNGQRLSGEKGISEPVLLSTGDVLQLAPILAENGDRDARRRVSMKVEHAGLLGAGDVAEAQVKAQAKAQTRLNVDPQPLTPTQTQPNFGQRQKHRVGTEVALLETRGWFYGTITAARTTEEEKLLRYYYDVKTKLLDDNLDCIRKSCPPHAIIPIPPPGFSLPELQPQEKVLVLPPGAWSFKEARVNRTIGGGSMVRVVLSEKGPGRIVDIDRRFILDVDIAEEPYVYKYTSLG